ncbi:hypothetical protein RA2_04477 [Roseovarius sp. A-2]|nr:hypothetical protein RA2_04477 [Roseovarius sp. A-2]
MDAPETAGAKTQAVMGNTGGEAAGAGSPIDRPVGSARECGKSCFQDEAKTKGKDKGSRCLRLMECALVRAALFLNLGGGQLGRHIYCVQTEIDFVVVGLGAVCGKGLSEILLDFNGILDGADGLVGVQRPLWLTG